MADEPPFKLDLKIFGVVPGDPGWLYVIKSGTLFKVGRTSSGDMSRLRAAQTWLPDMELVGIKPFWGISEVERAVHTGLSRWWYKGEWFQFTDKEDLAFFFDDFIAFHDEDRDRNSVDFRYWMNGSGMAEFTLERSRTGTSLTKFKRQESGYCKPEHSAPANGWGSTPEK